MTREEAKKILAKPFRILAFALMPVMLYVLTLSVYRTVRWNLWKRAPYRTQVVRVGDLTLRVLLAENPYQWRVGLSRFPSLPDSIQGMLFIFPEEQEVNFWTVGMAYPVSIYFLDESFQIRGWVSCAKPCTVPPCDVYTTKARYVLEVPCPTSKSTPAWEKTDTNPLEKKVQVPVRRVHPFRVVKMRIPLDQVGHTG